MSTPEELLAKLSEKQAKSEGLKERIVRAQSWNQLFATPAAAESDFQGNLVDAWRFYCGENDSSVEYTVEANPNGDIHRVTRDRGHTTTYQRLLSGDVIITFYYPDKSPHSDIITPSIGNIAHSFTTADVLVIPAEKTILKIINNQDLYEEVRSRIGDLTMLHSHLRGKPATEGWEDTILYNGHLPQRIGHRLFPDSALETLAKLKETYPALVPQPQS